MNGTIFTNGCFDLFHAGHAWLLREAAAMGCELIVGVDSDDRVRKLKGPGRPVIPAWERVTIVRAVAGVTQAVLFDDLTHLLQDVRPSYLVKGARTREVIGEATVRQWGGLVRVLRPPPHIAKISTTEILARCRRK